VTTRTEFKPGDVVRYDRGAVRHCREGMAIAEARLDGVVLYDTYWRTPGDRHLLTYDELATAEVLFNLDDYDELTERESSARWEMYKPADRQTITSQHGLVVRCFIRAGAEPDLETQIGNAQREVDDAERKLKTAQWQLDVARRDLAELEAKR
jgi:hypothetical protein